MKNSNKTENKSKNEIRLSLALRENQYYKYILQILDQQLFLYRSLSILWNPETGSVFLISVVIIHIPSFPSFTVRKIKFQSPWIKEKESSKKFCLIKILSYILECQKAVLGCNINQCPLHETLNLSMKLWLTI